MNTTPILRCENLSKVFHDGKNKVEVLKGIDFVAQAGETIAILGRSGSGKSTFLHLLGGLDKPSAGDVFLGEQNLQTLNEKDRCRLRNKSFGFVYQFHHLLPEFSALENVAIPLLLGDMKIDQAQERAAEILTTVGLQARLKHRLAELSGGERQRVAIARALVTEPQYLLADEPTGNLDNHTAGEVFNLLQELNEKLHTTLIIVTHDKTLAEKMQRMLVMEEGKLD